MNKLKIMKQLYIFIATIVVASFSYAQDINFTVTVPDGTTAVRLTGTWWGWDPNGGPNAAPKAKLSFDWALTYDGKGMLFPMNSGLTYE